MTQYVLCRLNSDGEEEYYLCSRLSNDKLVSGWGVNLGLHSTLWYKPPTDLMDLFPGSYIRKIHLSLGEIFCVH